MSPIKKLLDQALHMPAKDRAKMAQELIESLDSPIVADRKIELSWQKEIQKRLGDIREGKTGFISWEDIRERLKKSPRVDR